MSFRRAFEAAVSWCLPEELRQADADTFRRAKLCATYNLTVPLWGPGFVVLLWLMGQHAIALAIAAGLSLTVVPLVLLRTTGSLTLAANTMSGGCALGLVICAWLEGGLRSPGIMWFPLAPMLAILIGGRRVGVFWATVMVVALLAFYFAERLGVTPPTLLLSGDAHTQLLRLALAIGAVVLFVFLAGMFESLKAHALHSLESTNAALTRAVEEAEAATRAKSDFLATMSHEIRTPLHGVFGMTDIALDTDDQAEARECLQRARACAETLLTIINDILDFSRIDSGKLALEAASFDPRDVLDGVLDTLAVAVGQRGLDLVGCVAADVPARVIGDPSRFRQILTNLAGNAVKFTEHGSVVIALAAHGVAPQAAQAEVAPAFVDGAPATPPVAEAAATPHMRLTGLVRDTGIGISDEQRTRIFGAFAQADTSTTRRYGGTGLGLAITQRLVELMDGSIDVESTPGEGTTFRFEVRLGISAPPPLPPATLPPGTRVLLLGSHEATRRHLLHLLRYAGCDAHTVDAGGLATAGPAAPDLPACDLIIVDLALPDLESLSLVRQLAATGTSGVPVVALLAVGRNAIGRLATRTFDAVVSKPIKAGPLLTTLAAVLGRRQPRGAVVASDAADPESDLQA
jgi:signal transduction histidine kinase/CheY-like chemotaxis protein